MYIYVNLHVLTCVPICTYMCTYASIPLHAGIIFMCLDHKWLFFFFLSQKHDFPKEDFGTQKISPNTPLSSLGNTGPD